MDDADLRNFIVFLTRNTLLERNKENREEVAESKEENITDSNEAKAS